MIKQTMAESVKSTARKMITKIIDEYYKLLQLELEFFRIIVLVEGMSLGNYNVHMTTSGKDEKIKKRRKIMEETIYKNKETIVNQYFLNMAKIIERSSRNKPASVIMLYELLSKNTNCLRNKDIENILNDFDENIKPHNDILRRIDEHRDKCLAHNEINVKCNHLDGLTTKDTEIILEDIKTFINALSIHLETPSIDESVIEKMKSDSFQKNYEIIKEMED